MLQKPFWQCLVHEQKLTGMPTSLSPKLTIERPTFSTAQFSATLGKRCEPPPKVATLQIYEIYGVNSAPPIIYLHFQNVSVSPITCLHVHWGGVFLMLHYTIVPQRTPGLCSLLPARMGRLDLAILNLYGPLANTERLPQSNHISISSTK